jgi:hypothetical protein
MYTYLVVALIKDTLHKRSFQCEEHDLIEQTYELALDYFTDLVDKLTPNISEDTLSLAMANAYYHTRDGFVLLTEAK